MPDTFELVLASRNQGKIDELKSMLSDLPVTVRSARELDLPEVEEDESTLEGNARKKARSAFEHTGLPALADDTGLEVNALNEAPGVRSARFAGENATDAENRHRLLEKLAEVEDRTAQFRTVLAFIDDNQIETIEGICEGHIIREERGDKGFGYDSIFIPRGEKRTFAELSPDEKNAISHRSRAFQAFAKKLRERLARE